MYMKIQWIILISLWCDSIIANPNFPSFENFKQHDQTSHQAPSVKRYPYPYYYPSWMTSFMGYNLNLKIPEIPTTVLTQKRIVLPAVKTQDDDWSCGINSATRVLKFHGHNVNYDQMREIRKKKFQIPLVNRLPFARGSTPLYRLGTRPGGVVELLKIHRRNSYSETQSSLSRIKQLLRFNRPVIALIRPSDRKINLAFGKKLTLPSLHWIVVSGYDQKLKRIYYYDTYANDERYYSEDRFMERWDWNHKLIKHALRFKPRTIFY